jgi:hypothetical protein
MKKYIALKLILALLLGLSVLFFCESLDGLMDLCIDLFCLEECDDPVLFEINNLVDALSVIVCKIWIAFESNPESIWSSIWLLYIYCYLRRQNIYKLLGIAHSKLSHQKYKAYLSSSKLLNLFRHVIQEESSFCLPFI